MIHNPTFHPGPMEFLWHYSRGEYLDWLDGCNGTIGWVRRPHRGIQRLDRIHFQRKQKRYIFDPSYTVRLNGAFEQVVRHCGNPNREGKTWITEELMDTYVQLHRLGYAWSFEAWRDGEPLGGGFGLHVGAYINVESMFHLVPNAGKAAYGQALLMLRQRGFEVVDTIYASDHLVNYGEEWIPLWQFEKMLPDLLSRPVSLSDSQPAPLLPWRLRVALPARRVARAVGRRVLQRLHLASLSAPAFLATHAESLALL